ncbi:major facilitator superfamily domain-containing protein [Xylaria arbuscula]|nr:major facilitator superfamily domain-containing protein [Xylaria arbuscula]
MASDPVTSEARSTGACLARPSPNEKTGSAESTDATDDVPYRKLKGISWAIAFIALASSTFLYALDNTVMANVRPSIIETFGRIDLLPWLSVSYPLGELGSNPLWARLNKSFNNKTLYLIAVLIFEIGSVVIGSAHSEQIVIIGRALAGIGGSGIYVGTIHIVSSLTTPRERAHYLNLVGVSWCFGTLLGPIVGGAFADSPATWRWAFYVNVVIAAIAVPACVILIPAILPPTTYTALERAKRIDILGFALFLGLVVSLISILSFGGALYPWNGSRLIALYVIAPIIWALFAIQQYLSFWTVERIFPIQLATHWEMVILFVWTSVTISNLVVTVYSLPLHFQFAFGQSSLGSGIYTIPFVGAIIVSIGTSGPVFARYSYYKMWFLGGGALMLIGSSLLTTINYSTSYGAISGFAIISGLGVGPVVQLGYTVAQMKVPQGSSPPDATAFLTCAQMAGLALSLGIATSVFLNLATNRIASILPGLPRDEIMASIDGTNDQLLNSLNADNLTLIHKIIAKTVGDIFYLNVAGAALGLVLVPFMKFEKLNLGG